jgi:hypothetical protein
VGAWAALVSTRDAIAVDVEGNALGEVHAKAARLPELAAALVESSGDLDAAKRARVEGAVKQVTRVSETLHQVADRGDAAATRRELKRLDGLLALIEAQYPPGVLGQPDSGHGDHTELGAPPAHGGAHAHATRPIGAVDVLPQSSLEVLARDDMSFSPSLLGPALGNPAGLGVRSSGGEG